MTSCAGSYANAHGGSQVASDGKYVSFSFTGVVVVGPVTKVRMGHHPLCKQPQSSWLRLTDKVGVRVRVKVGDCGRRAILFTLTI